MTVRKITKRTQTTQRYIMNSTKNGVVVECESVSEWQLAHRLEFAPNVKSFRHQPAEWVIGKGKESYKTVPDFEVVLNTGEIDHVEVKLLKAARPLLQRFITTRSELKAEGINYKVMTERQIRPCLMVIHNCQFLKPFKAYAVTSVSELRALLPTRPISLADLSRQIGSENMAMEMVARQLVYVDFHEKITMKSIVRPLRDGDYDDMYPQELILASKQQTAA